MRASVGPVAEYNSAPTTASIKYGDAVVTARRHLSPSQFARTPRIAVATEDNGWLGPLGLHSPMSPSGSLYGYGASPDWPQY